MKITAFLVLAFTLSALAEKPSDIIIEPDRWEMVRKPTVAPQPTTRPATSQPALGRFGAATAVRDTGYVAPSPQPRRIEQPLQIEREERAPRFEPIAVPRSTGGPVRVKGYTRRDGTYVQPHTRRRPRR